MSFSKLLPEQEQDVHMETASDGDEFETAAECTQLACSKPWGKGRPRSSSFKGSYAEPDSDPEIVTLDSSSQEELEIVFENVGDDSGQSTTHSEIMERHRNREYGFRRNVEATSRYAGGRFRGGNINVGNRYHDRDQEAHRREERERRDHHGRRDRDEHHDRAERDRPDSRRGYTRLQFRGRFPRN